MGLKWSVSLIILTIGTSMCAQPLSRIRLCYPMNCSTPGSSVHGIFSRQEYWSGLPFPSPRNLSKPGIKPVSLASPAFASRFFNTEPSGKPTIYQVETNIRKFSLPNCWKESGATGILVCC